jgi:hypothetical protein
MKFFKVMSENRSSSEIDATLDSMLEGVKKEIGGAETPEHKIVLKHLVETLKELIEKMP